MEKYLLRILTILSFGSYFMFLGAGLCYGSSHWIVTEGGKIQAQADSFFNLKCPYNLMSLLRQEERIALLQKLKDELLEQKKQLDSHDDNDTADFEGEFYSRNEDCLEAGKQLVDMDLYVSTIVTPDNKNIPIQDYLIPSTHSAPYPPNNLPNCNSHSSLEYSIHAFEHLIGVSNRHNLTSFQELELLQFLPFLRNNPDAYRDYIAYMLSQNTTSWLHYNLAAFYWRVHGNSSMAVDCLRRALHFSPREYKDIALVSLANILHRNHLSSEAAILLHTALDIDDKQSITHFTLANVYASLSEVNKSLLCYENVLVLDRMHNTEARVRRKAVLCHKKLEALLENKHRKLQGQLESLRSYQEKHEEWQSMQRTAVSEQLSVSDKVDKMIFYQQFKRGSRQSNGLTNDETPADDTHNDITLGNFHNVNNKINNLSKETHINKDNDGHGANGKSNEFASSQFYEDYLANIQQIPDLHITDSLGDWPSKGECDRNVQHYPLWSEFQTVFLPIDRRGFDVTHFLGLGQGLDVGQPHPFPWYPPNCQPLESSSAPPPSSSSPPPSSSSASFDILKSYEYLSVQNKALLKLKLEDSAMKEVLLSYVLHDENTEVTLEEVGQRILTALKNSIGPSWLLYNLAGLFWRVSGEPLKSIECINNALKTAPHEFKDVALVNLANVLYKIGKVKDAVKVMKEVLAINQYEAESVFFMGNLLAALGNIDMAIEKYQRALHIDATNDQILKNLRILLCLKKFYRGNSRYQQRAVDDDDDDDDDRSHRNLNVYNKEKCQKVDFNFEGRCGGADDDVKRGGKVVDFSDMKEKELKKLDRILVMNHLNEEDVGGDDDDYRRKFRRNNYYEDDLQKFRNVDDHSEVKFFKATPSVGGHDDDIPEGLLNNADHIKTHQHISLVELCNKINLTPNKKRIKLINPTSGEEAFVEDDFCQQILESSSQGKKTCNIRTTSHRKIQTPKPPCDYDPYTDLHPFSSEEAAFGGD